MKSRRGFTLLEIVLALGLATVLLAALYTAVKLHLTIAQTGPQVVERVQVARAVLERIRTDLTATLSTIPSKNSTATTSTTASAASGSTTGDDTGAETGSAIVQTGMWGDSQQLVLFVNTTTRDLDQSELLSAAGQVVSTSTVRRVAYYLATDSTRGDLLGRPFPLGLARQEIPAAAADTVDLSGDSSLQLATTSLIAPEVSDLQFQYFDGTEWVDTWGSDVPTAPPRAIAIVISLLPPAERAEQLQEYAAANTFSPVYRLVIAVPTWDPDTAASSTSSSSTSGTDTSSTSSSSSTTP
jgi:prepilin-type N-terminal cleavage/methylation domain-containing protein